MIGRLAGEQMIEQRIVFYGADPVSISIIRRVLQGINLPHVRIWALPTTARR